MSDVKGTVQVSTLEGIIRMLAHEGTEATIRAVAVGRLQTVVKTDNTLLDRAFRPPVVINTHPNSAPQRSGSWLQNRVEELEAKTAAQEKEIASLRRKQKGSSKVDLDEKRRSLSKVQAELNRVWGLLHNKCMAHSEPCPCPNCSNTVIRNARIHKTGRSHLNDVPGGQGWRSLSVSRTDCILVGSAVAFFSAPCHRIRAVSEGDGPRSFRLRYYVISANDLKILLGNLPFGELETFNAALQGFKGREAQGQTYGRSKKAQLTEQFNFKLILAPKVSKTNYRLQCEIRLDDLTTVRDEIMDINAQSVDQAISILNDEPPKKDKKGRWGNRAERRLWTWKRYRFLHEEKTKLMGEDEGVEPKYFDNDHLIMLANLCSKEIGSDITRSSVIGALDRLRKNPTLMEEPHNDDLIPYTEQ